MGIGWLQWNVRFWSFLKQPDNKNGSGTTGLLLTDIETGEYRTSSGLVGGT